MPTVATVGEKASFDNIQVDIQVSTMRTNQTTLTGLRRTETMTYLSK
jgi:hypothetical protein